MKVIDILKEYLQENGYDGLCNPEAECGCLIDDLCPCNSYMLECVPGYKKFVDDNDYIITNNKEVR